MLVRVAVLANIAAAGLLSAAYAFSHRLFGTADEMAHLDYAYQVWHGRLPVFEKGLSIDPPFGFHEPTQWTSQHPPLYYLLQAPFVGPLLDGHHWVMAGYAGRAVSTACGCLLVVAVMWTCRVLVPRRPAVWLSSGTLAAAHPAVVYIGGVDYNDNLLIATSTFVLGLTALILRHGVSRGRLVCFTLFAAGAMLTRSSGVMVVAVCGVTLVVFHLLRRPVPWRDLGGLVTAGLVAIVASGWFYVRNQILTGNLLGAQLGDDLPYLKNRVARPFGDVITDPNTWWQWHLVWGYGVVDSTVVAWALVGVPVVVASVLVALRVRSAPGWERAVAVLAVVLVVVVVVAQAQYVAQRGGASWRYLMPLMPLTTLAAAYVLACRRRLMPVLLTAWLLVAVLPLAVACARFLVTPEQYTTAPAYPGPTAIGLFLGGAALAVAVLSCVLVAGPATERPGRHASPERTAQHRTATSDG